MLAHFKRTMELIIYDSKLILNYLQGVQVKPES